MVTLLATTGSPQIDRIIAEIIGELEARFPQRARAYFLAGSYADHTAVAHLSDIDLFVIFAGEFISADEREAARSVAPAGSFRNGIRVDTFVTCEADLPSLHPLHLMALKSSCLLVFGEDIRPALPTPSMGAYTRDVVGGAIFFIGHVLRGSEVIRLPVTYPDPAGEFFGYDQKRVAHWYPESVDAGTKELVACATRIATASVAIQAQRVVLSKTESIRSYRTHINDAWAGYLETLYDHLKRKWQYRIPSDKADRMLLRRLCEQMPAFENHFLERYHRYLRRLSVSTEDEERAFGQARLKLLVV